RTASGFARVRTGKLSGVLQARMVASSESGPAAFRFAVIRTSCSCWQTCQRIASETAGCKFRSRKVRSGNCNGCQNSRQRSLSRMVRRTRTCPWMFTSLRIARTVGLLSTLPLDLRQSRLNLGVDGRFPETGLDLRRVAAGDAFLDLAVLGHDLLLVL